jgi:hypothetical protein
MLWSCLGVHSVEQRIVCPAKNVSTLFVRLSQQSFVKGLTRDSEEACGNTLIIA